MSHVRVALHVVPVYLRLEEFVGCPQLAVLPAEKLNFLSLLSNREALGFLELGHSFFAASALTVLATVQIDVF